MHVQCGQNWAVLSRHWTASLNVVWHLSPTLGGMWDCCGVSGELGALGKLGGGITNHGR